MKVARFTFIAALTLVAVRLASGVLIAQERNGAEPNGKHRHYRVTDLGTFGGTFSDALGINDKGWVDGFAAFADGTFHAFLWREASKRISARSADPTVRRASSWSILPSTRRARSAANLVGIAFSRPGRGSSSLMESADKQGRSA